MSAEHHEWLLVIAMLAIAVGYFCMGILWQNRKVSFWRVEWIKLEHDLALKEGRAPRNINSVKGP